MAQNNILPKAQSRLVDQAGQPTREFYHFFNALVNNVTAQIDDLAGVIDNLANVIVALGGDPETGAGIINVAAAVEGKADNTITITGTGSLGGGGDLTQDRFINLDGDVDTPPGVSFYGSPDGTNKGWAAFSANFATSMDADDNVTLDLAEVPDAGGGILQRTAFDAYGRKTGTSAATTTDLTEGGNLYFTNARADARITAARADSDGIASLIDGKLDPGQLPALAITDTFVVNTEAAMLALDCQQGDVAVRSDEQKSYILTAEPASTLANWQELLVPTAVGVASFNGRTGSVVPASGDYTFAQIGDRPTTLVGYNITDAATAAQGAKADTAVQSVTGGSVNNDDPLNPVVGAIGGGGVSAYLSASINVPSGSTVVVAFDQLAYDDDGWFSPSNPTRITVPSGVSRVRININAGFAAASGGSRIAFLNKNGNSNFVGRCTQRIAPSGGIDYLNASTGVIAVTPGDYFELAVSQTSGGSITINGDPAGFFTWISVEAVFPP